MKTEENTAQMRGGGGGGINKLIWPDLKFIIIKREREFEVQISIPFEILISKWALNYPVISATPPTAVMHLHGI